MKNNFEKFHEQETIILSASRPMHLKDLREYLAKVGFVEEDDFFFIDRQDNGSNWQSMQLADIEVFNDQKQLDLIEDEPWNKLSLSYLFATLPFEFASKFLDIVFHLANEFKLQAEHNGVACTKDDMLMTFYEYKEDVRNALSGDPGSEIARINIAITYPRTK